MSIPIMLVFIGKWTLAVRLKAIVNLYGHANDKAVAFNYGHQNVKYFKLLWQRDAFIE